MEVLVLDVLQCLFVGGNALQPAQRSHHGEQQVQLRMLRHRRLLKNHTFCRIEPRCQIIDHDLQRVFRDRGGVRVVAGQRMPVRDEVEALVGRVIL